MTTELKFFSASDARKAVANSEALFNQRYGMIFAAIEKEANLGKNEMVLDWCIHHVPEFTINIPPYSSPQLTSIQQVLITKLKSLGYTVDVFQHISERGGLGCMDDNPEPVKSYHIKVRW